MPGRARIRLHPAIPPVAHEKVDPVNKEDLARLDMFVRVNEFGDNYATDLPAGSAGQQSLDAIRRAVTTMTQDSATRVSLRLAGTNRRPALRDELATQLDAIARTAQLIATTTEGFAEPFQVPRPVRYGVVLSAAHAFLRDAAPVTAPFIANGLPATFLDTLRTTLTAFEQARRDHEAARVELSSARAGMRRAIADGMQAVKALDLIVRYQFAGNAEMQAAWRRARLIGARRGLKPVTAPVVTTPVQPSTGTATAPSTSSPPQPPQLRGSVEPAA